MANIKRFDLLCIGIFALLSVVMLSCGKKDSSRLLPNVTGAAFDVLVVGSPTVWKSSAGRALFDMLNEDMPGLPQAEPLFNISFIPEKDFSSILRPVRNIVLIEIDDKKYTQGRVSYFRNKWARTQAVVKITAPNQDEFIQIITEKQDEFTSFLVDAELNRIHNYFARYSNSEGAKIIYGMFGVHVTVPNFLKQSKVGTDFVWLSNGNAELRQDMIVYRYPYRGPEDFKLENLLQKRDSVLKEHIEGPSPNSYMTTEHRFEITHKKMNVDGEYRALVRGLWRVEGDLMGGPFVSKTYLDREHNQLITVEGFVFAPAHKKRNYLRQLESAVRSLRFPE